MPSPNNNRLISDFKRQVNRQNQRLLTPVKPIIELPRQTYTAAKKRGKWTKRILFFVVISLIALIGISAFWYNSNLQAVDSKSDKFVTIEITQNLSASHIADKLLAAGLIRNTLVFDMYTRLHGDRGQLKAGTYQLYFHDSLSSIVAKLVGGKGVEKSIMFVPGATIMDNRQKLIDAGFSAKDVDAALNANYSLSIMKDRPSGNDVEGYIYGDTYSFPYTATVSDVLNLSFQALSSVVDKYDLVDKYRARGLNLYEGITLASIVEREVHYASGSTVATNDQKIVAGIFYNRLNIGMMLGSDVTYKYIAEKLGLDSTPSLDSLYNTRKYAGLPPGPISSPGLSALLAVAEPATTNYWYFLVGDDQKIHYAATDADHQLNIRTYCQQSCASL